MGNGNRQTPDFRREAVRPTLTSGRMRREIAEDLGIELSTLARWLSRETIRLGCSANTLKNWVKKAEVDSGSHLSATFEKYAANGP